MDFSTTIVVFSICVCIYGFLRYSANRTVLALLNKFGIDKYWNGSMGVDTLEQLYHRTDNTVVRTKINMAILQIRASMVVIGCACLCILSFGFSYWK